MIWLKNEMNFYRISELTLATFIQRLIQRYNKNGNCRMNCAQKVPVQILIAPKKQRRKVAKADKNERISPKVHAHHQTMTKIPAKFQIV